MYAASAVAADRHGTPGDGSAGDLVVELKTFADREPITVGPRAAEYLCRLAEGWAFREHILPNGARQITDVLVPGDPIPAAMFARRETIACGKARVMILSQVSPRDDAASVFRSVIERSRETALRLMRGRLISLGRLDARARIAHLFTELHARLDRSGRIVDVEFACPLTQDQIADVLGLTSVHVNRTLQRLRTEGLLIVRRPRVVIPDVRRLRNATDLGADYRGYDEADDHDQL